MPTIADNEVLVRVLAAGVDRGAWHLMTGQPYLMRIAGVGFRAPKNPVLGRDLAGIVEAVGKDVTRFQLGDAVFGIGEGSFAEYARAREDKLALKPENLTFEQASAVAISGLTSSRKEFHEVSVPRAPAGLKGYPCTAQRTAGRTQLSKSLRLT